MNTPTPAQALGECLKLVEKATPGKLVVEHHCHDGGGLYVMVRNAQWEEAAGEHGIYEDDAYAFAAAVNFIRQHGQLFAGLEAELNKAVDECEKHDIATAALIGSRDGWRQRAEAAEARVREAEWLLRQTSDMLDPDDYHNKPCLARIAAFLAARG